MPSAVCDGFRIRAASRLCILRGAGDAAGGGQQPQLSTTPSPRRLIVAYRCSGELKDDGDVHPGDPACPISYHAGGPGRDQESSLGHLLRCSVG